MDINLKEYRLVYSEDKKKIQLHHASCSEKRTLVLEWDRDFPGGFSVNVLQDLAINHHLIFHPI